MHKVNIKIKKKKKKKKKKKGRSSHFKMAAILNNAGHFEGLRTHKTYLFFVFLFFVFSFLIPWASWYIHTVQPAPFRIEY